MTRVVTEHCGGVGLGTMRFAKRILIGSPDRQTDRFMIVQHERGGCRREHDLSVSTHCDPSGPTSHSDGVRGI